MKEVEESNLLEERKPSKVTEMGEENGHKIRRMAGV